MKKTVVIKVGTNVLTENSKKLSKKIVKQIVKQISWLYKNNYQVALITSGAVGAGREIINPKAKRSLLAATGQAYLMKLYNQELTKYNIKTAQFLLTREDFSNREHYLNLKQTLDEALKYKVLPIMNENDVISTYEITFGDNDRLATNTAITLGADYLLLLTNINGLYSADPNQNKSAKLINEINDISNQIKQYCSKQKSTQGLGGMSSKLTSVKLAMKAGITCFILNGFKDNIIQKALQNEQVGTKFVASKKNVKHKHRWLLSSTAIAQIIVDPGAKKALKNRKSLLLVGVDSIKGEFSKGEIVEIIDKQEEVIGYGVIDYNSKIVKKYLPKPKELKTEIIHANNITLL